MGYEVFFCYTFWCFIHFTAASNSIVVLANTIKQQPIAFLQDSVKCDKYVELKSIIFK